MNAKKQLSILLIVSLIITIVAMIFVSPVMIVVFLFLLIDAVISYKFEEIAEMKGHSGYLWWCFLLGIAGWAMVIALPDRTQKYRRSGRREIESSMSELPDL